MYNFQWVNDKCLSTSNKWMTNESRLKASVDALTKATVALGPLSKTYSQIFLKSPSKMLAFFTHKHWPRLIATGSTRASHSGVKVGPVRGPMHVMVVPWKSTKSVYRGEIKSNSPESTHHSLACGCKTFQTAWGRISSGTALQNNPWRLLQPERFLQWRIHPLVRARFEPWLQNLSEQIVP